MITTFPIIESVEQHKKYPLHFRHDYASINKLDLRRRKTVKNVQDSQNLPINNQMLQLSKDCLTLISKQSKRKDFIKCSSSEKWKTVQKIKCPESLSKKKEGLNKNFNRSKTDWQHNFVGSKYLQKIKQELNQTKYVVGVKSEQKINNQEKNMSCSAFHKKSQSIQLFDDEYPKFSLNLKNQHRISIQKFSRIKQHKERKMQRPKQPVKLVSYYGKRQEQVNFKKVCNLYEKYQPLEPWEDFSCNLSSMLFSKN